MWFFGFVWLVIGFWGVFVFVREKNYTFRNPVGVMLQCEGADSCAST